MQEVPKRKIGDKARIMDTPSARKIKLQNKIGVVTQMTKKKDEFGNDQYVVFFKKKDFKLLSGALLAKA